MFRGLLVSICAMALVCGCGCGGDDSEEPALLISTLEDTAVVLPIERGFEVVGSPMWGVIVGDTYTPGEDFNGLDEFTYRLPGDSAVLSATIEVTAVNDAPVANPLTRMTDIDTPFDIELTAMDVDGQPLTFSAISQPFFGFIGGTVPVIRYTPPVGTSITDTFQYLVRDEVGAISVGTVTVIVGSGNAEPSADDQTVATVFETPLDLTLSGPDPTSEALTFRVLTQPENGTVSGEPPNVVYTPDSGFVGDDKFQYDSFDGTGNSAPATVSIRVSRTPEPQDDSFAILESERVSDTLVGNDIDPDDDTLLVTAINGQTAAVGQEITLPSGALLSVAPDGGFDYQPNGAFMHLQDPAIVDPLIFDSFQDPNGVPFSYPENGVLMAGDFQLTEPDSFTYTVSDGVSEATATVTITITGVDDGPQDNPLVENTFDLPYNAITRLRITEPPLLGMFVDPEGEPAPYRNTGVAGLFASGPFVSGFAIDVDTTVATHPQLLALDEGEEFFLNWAYQVVDSVSVLRISPTLSGTARVIAVNDPPQAADDTYAVAAGQTLNLDAEAGVLANDSDPDTNDVLSVTLLGGAPLGTPLVNAAGTLTLSADGSFEFVAANVITNTTFSVVVTVGDGDVSATSNLRFDITPL